MKETVCVTGASGGIGQALLDQLVDRYRVNALFRARTPVSEGWQRRGCVAVYGDLADEAALSTLASGARFVFHCAAVVGQAPYDQAYAVNVAGTRCLARIAAAQGCQRIVHVSSIAVYSGTPHASDYVESTAITERSEMSVYSLTKLLAEEALTEVARQEGLEHTILRPTSVYGPHIKPYTLVPVDLIRKGLPVIVGDGNGLMDAVYVEDVVQAMLMAARSEAANGEIFNIGHETVTFNEFFAHFSRMLSRPARRLPVAAVAAVASASRIIPGFGAARSRALRRGVGFIVSMARNSKAYPSAKARALLRYTPQYSLALGMLKTEVWLKQRSLVPAARSYLPGYGALPFQPLALVHPATEREIVQVVELASSLGVRVRAVGALHSQCPIPQTDGICVVMNRYRNIVKAEGPLVTVQAGMTINELNQALADRKLALPTNGSITAQTVSGAISTATHGGSVFHGSLSDYVEALRIIRADGQTVDVDRSQELLRAAIVSFGLLGLISTVTFRCVPAFRLQARSSVMKATDVLADFDTIQRQNLHTCMLYFPVTDDVEILAINRVETGDPDVPEETARNQPQPRRRLLARTGRRLVPAALRSLAWVVLRSEYIQRRITRMSVGSAYRLRAGRSDIVLAISDGGSSDRSSAMLQDMEIAIPYEKAGEAIEVMRAHFAATRTYPLLPIHIRCAARSDLWLNPAYQRDVCWLELWQYPRSDEGLFSEVHALMKPFNYRFHWGKETRADRDYIAPQYERWDDFVRLRQSMDPGGMFLNRYLEKFFGASI